jgi:hypothetical protein
VRTLRTNRETIPEGFQDEVLSDHITRNREASQQVNDPQSLPVHEVARVRFDDATALIHQTSRGDPRAVNNLAISALLAASAAGKAIIDVSSARGGDRSHDRMSTPATT